MSGHSHWAKIRRGKAATDARRGRLWSKLARRVIVAARHGGGNADENLTLRYAVDDCKAANMPNDTIERAIKKGTGELGGENYEAVLYEGYGPGGVAFMVDCLTDNRNRTAADIRKMFERSGGQLGASGCVAWMFQQKGTFVVSAELADEDTLMEIALEAGADDYQKSQDVWEITCEPAAFEPLREALAAAGIEPQSAELSMVPSSTVPLDADRGRKVLNLVEALEEHDDVQNVYANFEIPDHVMAALSA